MGSERKRGLGPRSIAAMEAGASSASASTASPATGQLLDRCYRRLEAQGFGPMALATLQIEDWGDIAKQLAFELNLPYCELIVEALAIWIQDARSEAKLLSRTYGLLADDITWRQLAPVAREVPVYVEEPRPPPGDKARKLINDGQETQATADMDEKVGPRTPASEAPVLKKLQLSLDPERASELLAGSTRPNTQTLCG